jgi:ATP-dependent protease Clp ATPase subunit
MFTLLQNALVPLLLACFSFLFGVVEGKNYVQTKWEKEKATQQALVTSYEERIKELSSATKVTYVTKVEKIHENKQKRINEREKSTNENAVTLLPSNFRLFHDAAATNSTLSETANGTINAAVSLADVTNTIEANYTSCNEIRERLIALQQYSVAVATKDENK